MPESKFLDDIAKFGNTTLNAMTGMQKQFRKWSSEQIDIAIKNTELVTQKHLETYNLGLSKLMARVEELEKELAVLKTGKAAPKAKKPKAKSK